MATEFSYNLGDGFEFERYIPTDEVGKFAEIVGDLNPIHLDDEFAERSFFKKRIMHGAFLAGLISKVLGMDFPGTPPSPYIRAMQVPSGFDVADNHIVEKVEAGDLVVTADIPLAAAVIARGAHALNPRGELYTKDNIRERLNMRDFLDTLRGSGIQSGGPPALAHSDRQAFANQLDRLLNRYTKARGPAAG